jgi:phosphoribosylanthranilate isomerase
VWIKICGITSAADAALSVGLGADALGINLVPSSKRYVEPARVRAIVEPVLGKVELVGIVANLDYAELERLQRELGFDWLQLHGSDPRELLARLPRAYTAVGIDDEADVARAASFGGDRVLVDKKAPGELGGTGRPFRWSLVETLAKQQKLVLAGGLEPNNVGKAIDEVRPFGVDVASGVEPHGKPGIKDRDLVQRFIEASRAAARKDAPLDTPRAPE